MIIYTVGGAVRDELMGLTPADIDYVIVGATQPDIDMLLSTGYKFVGVDFPVLLGPDGCEYALARIERKQGTGHTGFQCDTTNVTLEQDLYRRDLTINAIARSSDGSIVDPYNGQSDLDNRILRHVSPAFSEDPLRVLRVARFAARFGNFSIAPETMELMETISAQPELYQLSPHRIWNETEKALRCNYAWKYFDTLLKTYAINAVLPGGDTTALQQGILLLSQCHPQLDSVEKLGILLYHFDYQQLVDIFSRITIPTTYQQFILTVVKSKQSMLDLHDGDNQPDSIMSLFMSLHGFDHTRPLLFKQLLRVYYQTYHIPTPVILMMYDLFNTFNDEPYQSEYKLLIGTQQGPNIAKSLHSLRLRYCCL
jgi:tRNA nucleotidyltransferase/poly(A) polymerase